MVPSTSRSKQRNLLSSCDWGVSFLLALSDAFKWGLYLLEERGLRAWPAVFLDRRGVDGALKIDWVLAIANSSGKAWQVEMCNSESRGSIST